MTSPIQPRLVVVDDEASLRELLADYLGKHGFSVETAADGRALDILLAAAAADLILLDVNSSVLRHLRRGTSRCRRIAGSRCVRPRWRTSRS
jgi:two-component system OmpR family response regulator